MSASSDRESQNAVVATEQPAESLCEQVESYIVQQPIKAMVMAVLAGFVFSRIAF
ncbi:MAG TPA: hypothetical protein VHL34_04775 [Rhizomicrobium sp.]|jgi:hypothetical protein|nr:hypothetical protein [Rhizomicrobium sp.]